MNESPYWNDYEGPRDSLPERELDPPDDINELNETLEDIARRETLEEFALRQDQEDRGKEK